MATVKYNLDPNKPLTAEETAMLNHAREMPYEPDDDAPELSSKQIAEFRKIIEERKRQAQKHTVSLRLSKHTIDLAKSLGSSYTTILATILENVCQHPEELKKYI